MAMSGDKPVKYDKRIFNFDFELLPEVKAAIRDNNSVGLYMLAKSGGQHTKEQRGKIVEALSENKALCDAIVTKRSADAKADAKAAADIVINNFGKFAVSAHYALVYTSQCAEAKITDAGKFSHIDQSEGHAFSLLKQPDNDTHQTIYFYNAYDYSAHKDQRGLIKTWILGCDELRVAFLEHLLKSLAHYDLPEDKWLETKDYGSIKNFEKEIKGALQAVYKNENDRRDALLYLAAQIFEKYYSCYRSKVPLYGEKRNERIVDHFQYVFPIEAFGEPHNPVVDPKAREDALYQHVKKLIKTNPPKPIAKNAAEAAAAAAAPPAARRT